MNKLKGKKTFTYIQKIFIKSSNINKFEIKFDIKLKNYIINLIVNKKICQHISNQIYIVIQFI